jgi:hypothetical protein
MPDLDLLARGVLALAAGVLGTTTRSRSSLFTLSFSLSSSELESTTDSERAGGAAAAAALVFFDDDDFLADEGPATADMVEGVGCGLLCWEGRCGCR